MRPQSVIAHYRITAKLGEGGMGEVWRATDTKLGRDVAIKVLPKAFAQDASRMARFQNEARVLASLNHPNIAAIYGVEEGALVLELVTGPTLAEHIARGPLPLDEALGYAMQIIEALDYAHEKGIVHRDLKPANMKITSDGRLKVLDFGLAKALANEATSPDRANSPTLTMNSSEAGIILGTASYMAPEQARGQRVDKRADIWAFGAVLYEMLTGRRAFEGDTVSDVLSSVLTKEPDWERLPTKLRWLIRACLERDQKRRLQDIGDSWRLIAAAEPAPAQRSRYAWVIAAIAFAVALAVAVGHMPHPAEQAANQPAINLDLDLGGKVPSSNLGAIAILSPDGSRVVFVSEAMDGTSHLATRRLDQPNAAELPGTEGAYFPFFSPDGQWVGFFANGKLKKTRLDGGEPIVLCDAPSGRGAAWNEDNTIIATLDPRRGLWQLPAEGGEVNRIASVDPQAGEYSLRLPQNLPGGKAVLFLIARVPGEYQGASIAVMSLADRKKKILLDRVGMHPRYVAGSLTYVSKGTMFAVPFDSDRLEVRGPAKPILEGIANHPGVGYAQVDFSRDGMLLYRKGRTEGVGALAWVDRAGNAESLLTAPSAYTTQPRISPDGDRVAAMVFDGPNASIWVYDWKRGTRIRVPGPSNAYSFPAWTANGRYLLLQGTGGLYWVRVDAAKDPQLLIKGGGVIAGEMTADGSRLPFYEWNSSGDAVIRTVTMNYNSGEPKAGEPEIFLTVKTGTPSPAFSPDGRWLAYMDAESGSNQIYVRAYPDRGERWQISSNGGSMPVWSRTRPELLYQSEDGRAMAVSYTVRGSSFEPDKPRPWTPRQLAILGLTPTYDLAPNGERVVALLPADTAGSRETPGHVTVMLNFPNELRRRMGK
jgi:serine/threonine-protein kinase